MVVTAGLPRCGWTVAARPAHLRLGGPITILPVETPLPGWVASAAPTAQNPGCAVLSCLQSNSQAAISKNGSLRFLSGRNLIRSNICKLRLQGLVFIPYLGDISCKVVLLVQLARSFSHSLESCSHALLSRKLGPYVTALA